MFWSNFIHIYQPPTQTFEIVEKVTNECYRTLVRILKKYGNAKITLNINACLTEQLAKYNYNDVIEGFRELAENGQVEFTASAKYHPILPLLPEDEVIRQIELNTQINKKYFGEAYNPSGFFPPEMCYSENLAKIIKNLGFKWIIVDEIAYNGKLVQVKNDKLYKIKGLDDFYVFFKERAFSAGLTYGKYDKYNKFLNDIKKLNSKEFLLTGTDGEIYGHHRPGQENLLIEVYEKKSIKTSTISELFNYYNDFEYVSPLASSWSTWEKEMEKGVCYPQWDYPNNDVHRMQWELAYLVINIINDYEKKSIVGDMARKFLDKGLYSCQWWWASARPWWDTGMIITGAEQLYSSVEILNGKIDSKDIDKAFSLKENIIKTAQKMWNTGEALKLKQKYKEEFTEVENELSFG